MGTMERREELIGTNKALKALFPVQVIPEEMESDDENAKEVIPDNIPYWPNLEQK